MKLSLWIAVAAMALAAACSTPPAVQLLGAGSRVVATVDGEMFAEYRGDAPRGPALWPLVAPGGEPMTRAFPFFALDGEPNDHPHHTSLWFAHGKLDGVDCWQGEGRYRMVVPPVVRGELVEQWGEWLAGTGAVLLQERRTLQFQGAGDWRQVDVAIALRSDQKAWQLGETTAGGLGLRLRRELCLDGRGAIGRWWNSEGLSGTLVDNRRARWLAAAVRLAGVPYTLAVMDHPDNHAHPTVWQARQYGLWIASPTAPPASACEVAAGAELRLRYRVYLQRGDCTQQQLDAVFAGFAATVWP